MTNPVYKWDFTLKSADVAECEVIRLMKSISKKYVFQKELGKSGYEHYQGRFSLKEKSRFNQVKKLMPVSCHLSPTSSGCKDFDYCMKEDTRIGNVCKDTDEVIYIPRQIRMMKTLRPFQQQIVDSVNDFDTRIINMVYCPRGNIGKSSLVGYMRAHKLGRCLPPVNDYKDLMRMVCDMPTSTCYLIDMPRALKKDKLGGFYTAIEDVKNGYAWDDRYKFREKVFDCPNIWIFSNILPDFDLLSKDKWKIWTVNDNGHLEAEQSPCNTTPNDDIYTFKPLEQLEQKA